MYIEPNTTIKLLTGVPLDETYEHTLYFANKTNQTNYFSSKAKYTMSNSTYQRVNRGIIKVPYPADRLYDCNYLMFLNSGFGTKWFYAFITSVEYVNTDVSLITFVIDDMQTWAFDYELEQCFVEREHSVTDNIGDNTVPEGLELGGYITTAETSNYSTSGFGILFLATEDLPATGDYPATNLNPPMQIGGYPLNCYWKLWKVIARPLLNNILLQVQSMCNLFSERGKAESIISISTVPIDFTEEIQSSTLEEIINGASRTLTITPKNKKLYCYPYCCLGIIAGGQGTELKYELFNGSPQLYTIRSIASPSAGISVIPYNYEGMNYDYNKCLTLKGYPLLAWINNYFQNWLAQNRSSIIASSVQTGISSLSGGVMLGLAGVTGSPMLAVGGFSQMASGIGKVFGTLAEIEKHKIIPDNLGGLMDSADNLFCASKLAIRTYCRCIRSEYALKIDDFFTRFGYKTNRNKIPNTHSRPHWNYVKTISCTAKGSMPADSMRHICSIYDNGITFWKNPDEVGNYSLNNSPQ